METKVIKIDTENPESGKINEAASIIKQNGLVAFPTETVYGLGANGLNEEAVKSIFEAKGRPLDNPLILHISKIDELDSLVVNIPDNAKKLMEKFWPGPLTIVMQRSEKIPDVITCGLDTVAIRIPENKIALELIKCSELPIAAPSANISGKPSPTNAKHVIDDLNGKVDVIIDGGSVNIGLESTVIDVTQNPPVILRPGKVTKEEIEKIIGKLENKKMEQVETPKSPGMKYKHYSPNAKVIIISDDSELDEIKEKYPDKKIKHIKYENETIMARDMFNDFRNADKDGYDILVVNDVEDCGLGCAIMNRLRKASTKK